MGARCVGQYALCWVDRWRYLDRRWQPRFARQGTSLTQMPALLGIAGASGGSQAHRAIWFPRESWYNCSIPLCVCVLCSFQWVQGAPADFMLFRLS